MAVCLPINERQREPQTASSASIRLVVGWFFFLFAACLFVSLRDQFEPWVRMWIALAALVASFKLLTLLRLNADERLSPIRLIGYLLLWPGMRPQICSRSSPTDDAYTKSLWRTGLLSLLHGGIILWGVNRLSHESGLPEVSAWLGMIGLSLVIHFGLFDLMAAIWRTLGVPVEKLFRNPLRATSLADFWGNRWNRAFSEFARDLIFRPIARWVGARWATLAVFLFSGLVHELAITVPAGGGYGGPTLYFLIQGTLLQVESLPLGRVTIRRHRVAGWLWTAASVLAPLPLLFPAPFLNNVVMPFLEIIT